MMSMSFFFLLLVVCATGQKDLADARFNFLGEAPKNPTDSWNERRDGREKRKRSEETEGIDGGGVLKRRKAKKKTDPRLTATSTSSGKARHKRKNNREGGVFLALIWSHLNPA
jgi:hypothetical protein